LSLYVSVVIIGKCAHGGPRDASRNLSPTGGINKDTDDARLSPHSYLHQAVSDVL